MNAELQELRRHYQHLDAHVKARKTAQSLLRAIQIAEGYETSLLFIRHALDTDSPTTERSPSSALSVAKAALARARVTKQEGE